MSHQVILHYDERLIRRAVLRFWWRMVGIRFLVAMAVLAASLVILVFDGNTSWFVGVLATTLTAGIGVMVMLYVVHYRNALQRLKAMGQPQATLTLSEATLSTASGAGSSTVPWSAVSELWLFPDLWLLFISKSHFVTLPLCGFTPEAKAFFVERVQTSGGKIR